MKVAIVHDWLATWAGSEKVLEQLLLLYPEADLYTTIDVLPAADRGGLRGRVPRTSFVQRLPLARRHFRAWLPLMPLAVEQFDLSRYDVVLSSNHAMAKGVITGPDQLHVSYVHSPMRWAWDLQHQYLAESGLQRGLRGALLGPAVRLLLHRLRGWDQRSAQGVDHFIANSRFIARRIRKAWRRDAQVIHPPADIERFALRRDKEDFYVTVSRMVPYKRVPLIVEAFAGMPDRRLVVIGDGPEFERARRLAPKNVELLGFQPADVVVDHLQRARAFVFAAEEDFGIAPVEAMACGTPVIAYGRGGALDTVREGGDAPTGLFFEQQSVDSIRDAVERFEALRLDPLHCRARAEQFSPALFRARVKAFVDARWASFARDALAPPRAAAAQRPSMLVDGDAGELDLARGERG